jgi:hypothetical protein
MIQFSALHSPPVTDSSAKQVRLEDSVNHLKQISFDDYFWDDAFTFLKQYASSEQKFLLPDELCHIPSIAFSYAQSYTEEVQSFDWILLHKGRLFNLPLQVLHDIYRLFVPVFANEVFVLFSHPKIARSQAIPRVKRSPHVRSLLMKLRARKIEQSLENLSVANTLKTEIKPRRKSTLLIEEVPQNSWFRRNWFARKPPISFVPVSWAATSEDYLAANLGDALSPILVSALSGLPAVHRGFESWERRLACVGTIAHGFQHGVVHFWGTGIDRLKNPIDQSLTGYQKPEKTNFHVHAVRGRFTAKVLRQQGIKVPPIYGDPVWFLPSIIKPAAEKRYELGVVVHLTELTEQSSTADVDPTLLRYQIPPSLRDSIRIITTLTDPSFAALEKRVQEITSCKRIVSTSLHGLVISETYGIPCAYFRVTGRGPAFAPLADDQERIDWRIRDFYSGVEIEKLFLYGQRRVEPTNWEDVIQAIDSYWQPLDWSPEAFLDAFPLPLAFNPLEQRFDNRSLLEQIKL